MRLFMATMIAGIFAIPSAAQPAQNPDPLTRDFPGQKCRFTLPGKDWRWRDSDANLVFTATNEIGLDLSLRCDQIIGWDSMDQSAADNFEQGLARSSKGQLKKRGGRFIVFQGLSCYQFEGVYADGRTMVSRVAVAFGLAYHIMLVGGKEPVEQLPDFEKIMSGFAFTTPPVVSKPRYSALEAIYYLGLLIVGIVGVGVYLYRRVQPAKSPGGKFPVYVDDDIDEEIPAAMPVLPGHTGVVAARSLDPLPRRPIQPIRRSRPEPFDSDPDEFQARGSEGTGRCRHCGYAPLAFNADGCPNCFGKNPNPGVISRCVNWGVWIGAALGASIGIAWGFVTLGGGGAGAIGGVLLGTLPGMIGGMLSGLGIGIMLRLSGSR